MKILLPPLLLLFAPYATIEALHVTTDGPPENQPPETFEPDSDRFIVRYKNGRGKSSAQAAAQKVHVDLGPQHAIAVTLSSEALRGLQNNPNIEYVEQDHPRHNMMMRGHQSNDVVKEHMHNHATRGDNQRKLTETVPYGIEMVQADLVDPDNATPIKICIIDSGISRSHEDLVDLTEVNGIDDARSGSWYIDNCHHGTQ
jgi:serine protease